MLRAAHAHNDYVHRRPLLDALAHRFGSVEVDVFLVDGALLVGHSRAELTPQRTLEALYLDPLQSHVEAAGGMVFPGGEPLLLLVDVKSDAVETYAALRRSLEPYRRLLAPAGGPDGSAAPCRVVVSGNRAIDAIAADASRLVAIDGRLEDLDRDDRPAELFPWISDRWHKRFAWDGEGPFPEDERRRLADLVGRARARGQRLRFWGTPERESVWAVLREAGVDLIGTDDLGRLQRFLEGPGAAVGGP
jgi:hypothetical protein